MIPPKIWVPLKGFDINRTGDNNSGGGWAIYRNKKWSEGPADVSRFRKEARKLSKELFTVVKCIRTTDIALILESYYKSNVMCPFMTDTVKDFRNDSW